MKLYQTSANCFEDVQTKNIRDQQQNNSGQ